MPVCYPLNWLSFPGKEKLLLKGKWCLHYTGSNGAWPLAYTPSASTLPILALGSPLIPADPKIVLRIHISREESKRFLPADSVPGALRHLGQNSGGRAPRPTFRE